MSTEHNRWATHRGPTRWLNRFTSRWDDVSFAVTDEVARVDVRPRHQAGGDPAARHRRGVDGARRRPIVTPCGPNSGSGSTRSSSARSPTSARRRTTRTCCRRHACSPIVRCPCDSWPSARARRKREIRKLHDDLGLGDTVILTGFRDDAVRVMGACDVFTLASQWEGLPVALMEALALGLPVVATNVGGVGRGDARRRRRAARPADAIPTALADALERVVTDPALREQLGAASAARAGDFDVRRAVDRIEAAYAELAPEAAAERAAPGRQADARPLPHGSRHP